MKVGLKLLIRYVIAFAMLGVVWFGFANSIPDALEPSYRLSKPIQDNFVLPTDTGKVELPLPHGGEDPNNPTENTGGVSLDWPENIHYSVEYDPTTGNYVVFQTIGDSIRFRMPTTYTLDEYLELNKDQNISEYWNKLQDDEDAEDKAFEPKLTVKGEFFDRVFGGNEILIKPQGSAELTFGINVSKTDNPRIPLRQRTITTFDFRQRIQLNVTASIGTKMQINSQYNTEATFDFENQFKVEYTGEEDEIIKKIEAGNVSLPLRGTLISGSTSLFGLKMETQFGKLRNTTVFSQQKGERKEISVEGGAQTQTFDLRADNYEANKHYFLSNWFRDQYDRALESLPVVNSGVNITRIEVWIVNQQANTQDVRNVLGFTDIGENQAYMSSNLNVSSYIDDPTLSITNNPSNTNNEIFAAVTGNETIMGFTGANAQIATDFPDFQQGIHYERVGNARKLSPSEFTYNSRLGFVSLRQSLNNAEVLAVSYEYTLNGETFQVGTLSQDGYTAPSALALKMLKSSITTVTLDNGAPSPLWDQMMKNVYSIGAFGVNSDNFRLDVWYNDPSTGVDLNYIPRNPLDGDLLIQVLNMDQLDVNGMSTPDGVFDYVDNAATQGGLIESQTGRIFFPVVEPFGSHLADVIRERLPSEPDLAEAVVSTVVYQPLYDSTKTAAQQIPSLNRFRLKGQFQSSSSSEISLNALNVPQGSVSVTAGGVRLVEGQDYTVDYNLGRVRILNEGLLDSGQPIKVSLESNSLFNIQTKTMIGTRFDYTVNDRLSLGATVLNLRERPLTQKVNIGDEPVNNTILGADLAYQTESGFITKMVDKIPFIDTKEKSMLDFSAEGAYLIPGHSRAVGKDGNAYLDDFEGSQSTIDIRSFNQWFLASTPRLQNSLFPEGVLEDDLEYNYNRGKFSWYVIDPQFFRGNGLTDAQVSDDARSDHRSREVLENEVFPNRELPAGTPPNIATFDMSFYPEERGTYNYVPADGSQYANGLNNDGTLLDPESRWGGIQRALTTTDFEASNIEFIQFWLMDPFNEDSPNSTGGDLYFNLGNVSEDILNDSQLSYENGLPSQNQDLPTLISTWGVYPDPSTFNVVNAFDNSSGNYAQQDVGIDGMADAAERDFFADWLAEVQAFLTPEAYASYVSDPSADNYTYFRNPEFQSQDASILERYKYFNGYEGNSNTSTPDGYPIAATTIPNTEDINSDITLGTIEAYYQYKVSLRQADLGEGNIGSNYITDSFVQNVSTPNGDRTVRWYQFKVPIREYEKRVGSISDFRSIRFIRMFMKGWEQEVTLRFARLELIRGEWRQFLGSLAGAQEYVPDDPDPTVFNIGAVNIEENGNRDPIPYVTPPGIQREIDVATANQRQLNEQSLALNVCNLEDGDARGAYRNVNFDMRMYEKLKMFVHAEAGLEEEVLNDNDVTCFIRLGSDFDDNYYEYELPVKVTPWYTADDDAIWPSENDIEIEFKKLQELKVQRPVGFPVQQIYSQLDGNASIKIKGNPNLANVIVLMIGVRNPDQDENEFGSDDGLKKCATIWANELRLTDFNEEGGWAAIARMNATLADFGNVSVAGNISKPGWGTLEQRVQERQRETIVGVDANSTLQLGKFFPENLGIQFPLYMGYSESVTTPQFDPLRPDIEIDQVQLTRPEKKRAQSIVRRRSINVTNFRIAPTGKAPKDLNKEKEKGKGKKEGLGQADLFG
ncbi:MAG: cell surface protein SprA, partial [Flavobacteriales bacterium]